MLYSVILVDDEKIIIEGLSKYIPWNKLGFDLKGAFTKGKEALDYLGNNEVDLVITDMEMTFVTGIELMKNIEENHPETKVAILSAHSDFSYANAAIRYRALAYMLKSSSFEEIEDNLLYVKKLIDDFKSTKLQSEENIEIKRYIKEEFLMNVFNGLYNNSKPVPLPPLKIKVNMNVAKAYLYELPKEVINPFDYYGSDSLYNIVYNVLEMGGENANEEYMVLIDEHSVKFLVLYAVYLDPENITKTFQALYHIQENQWNIRHFESIFDLFSAFEDRNSKNRLQNTIAEFRTELISKNYNNARHLCGEIFNISVLYGYDFQVIYDEMFNFLKEDINDIQSEIISSVNFKSCCLKYIEMIQDRVEESNTTEKLVNKILEYIEKNISEDITLRDVASSFFMSYEYLSRIFKRKTGQNFKSYLIDLRMNRAAGLLRDTNALILKVSEMVGYKNEHYFCLAFRKFSGYAPTEYRQMHRREG